MQNRLRYLQFASTTLVFWLTFTFLPSISNYQPTVVQASTIAEQEPGAEKWFLDVYELWLKGEYTATLAKLQQYLTDFREKGDRAREGAVIACIGIAYRSMGNYNQGLEYLQQALAIFREDSLQDNSTARIWKGRTLDQMGLIYSLLGQYPQAFASAEQALIINRKVGDRIWEGRTLNNLANLYASLGQNTKALKLYQQALVIHQEIGNEPEVGVTLANMGAIHSFLEQYTQALNYYNQALVINQKIGDRAREAASLNGIGQVYRNLKQYAKALEYYQQALEIGRKINDKRREGATLTSIGVVSFLLKQYPKALESYQQALAISTEIGYKELTGVNFFLIGRTLEVENQRELAIVFYKQSVNIIEEIRKDIGKLSKQQQQSYIENYTVIYRILADLLLKKDRILEAQQVLDLLKLQELDDYLENVRGNEKTARGLSTTLQEQQVKEGYEAIVNKGIKLGKELAELQKIPVDKRSSAQQQRILELRKAEQEITKEFSEFLKSPTVTALVAQLRQVTGDENLNLKDFNSLRDNLQRLQQSAVILYPFILDDRLELILVTPYSPPIRRTVNVKREELNRVIAEFHLSLKQPNSNVIPVANQLYNWLIKPIENDLAEAKTQTIIYAPDGQLRYIPLAALHDGKQWLVERFGINYITAASLTDLNTKRQEKMQVFAGAFTQGSYTFKVGEQEFQFSGLPFAGREVENLAATIPGTTKLLNGQFNRDSVLMMNDFSVVHLATHAAFVVGNPEDSFIMFGNGDRATLRDVESWSLPKVDLIVLSACETGVGGKLGNGEEILGFGFQMQRTGAKAAIASLWPVSDGGTQVLINGFYSILQKGNISKAEALRQAQIALITGNHSAFGQQRGIVTAQRREESETRRLNHPYYWAPFILIGNGL